MTHGCPQTKIYLGSWKLFLDSSLFIGGLNFMAQEIRLPKLGDTMEEAAIVACRVKVGDEVQRGTVVFDIETDKAAMELESPAAGFVKAILVEADQTVPVGTPLLVLGAKDEQILQSYISAISHQPSAASTLFSVASTKESQQPPPISEPRVTSNGPPVYMFGQKIPATPLQKLIAQKMLQSKREIPCFYLNIRPDVTELVAFRQKLNRDAGVKISFNDFIMLAMARALRQFPIMTGQLAGDYIRLADSINIGLAIALPDGFVAPILRDVDKKTIRQIAAESKTLIEKARTGKLLPADFEGGCITLSNLGAFGVESFVPIVIPGQCSILGVGKIMDTCVPAGDDMTVRKLMNLTLAVDHKVANGAYAAQFLEYIAKLLADTGTFA
jgi:pyruvate dehydrogenase E2 component (dihydrolipoamide acetyltransferase)